MVKSQYTFYLDSAECDVFAVCNRMPDGRILKGIGIALWASDIWWQKLDWYWTSTDAIDTYVKPQSLNC